MAFTNVASQELIYTSTVGLSAPISQAFTIPDLAANSIGAVMIGIHTLGATTPVVSGVTWGGSAMTKTIPASNNWDAYPLAHMWHLVNPPDNGSKTIEITFSAPSVAVSVSVHVVVAYADAEAAVTLDDTSEETGTTQNPDIVSTQAGANELVFSISVSTANAVAASPVTGCTLLQDYDSGGNCSIAAYSIPAGSGDATHQHNYSQSGNYAIISASFKEESAGGTTYYGYLSGTVAFAGAYNTLIGAGIPGSFGLSGLANKDTQTYKVGSLSPAGTPIKEVQKNLLGVTSFAGLLEYSKFFIKELSGSLDFVGNLIKDIGKNTVGSTSFSSSINKDIASNQSGDVGSSGSLIKFISSFYSGVITTSGDVGALKAFFVSLAAALGFGGSITKQVNKNLSGSVSSSGSLIKFISAYLTGVLTTIGDASTSQAILVELFGAFGFGGELNRQTNKNLSGSISSSGSLIKFISSYLSGVLVTIGDISTSQAILVELVGAFGLSGEVAKDIYKTLVGSLSSAGSITKEIWYNLVGNVTSSGNTTKHVQTSFSGDLPVSGGLGYLKAFFKELLATVGFSSDINKQINKNVSSNITFESLLNKLVSKINSGSFGFVGQAGKTFFVVLGGTITFAGTLLGEIVSLLTVRIFDVTLPVRSFVMTIMKRFGFEESLTLRSRSYLSATEDIPNEYLIKALSYNPTALWTLLVDANDSSGNGYHGTLKGDAVIQDATGADGRGSMYLAMTDDYLDVYSPELAAAWNGDEFCIGGWFKQEAAALTDGIYHDMPVFYNADLSHQLFLRSLNGNVGVARSAGTLQTWSYIATPFGSGWRHIMLRCSVSGASMQLYFDGVATAPNVAVIGNWANGLYSLGALWGASPAAPKIHEWYGWMQYVGIWPVLSAEQIADLASI